MSNLTNHAKDELKRAGLFDADSDYNGMLGKAVVELIEAFSKQGHSGYSAAIVRQLFHKLSNFEALTPISSNPNEWMEVGENMWQSRRQSTLFSKDGGKTWYDIDAPKRKWYQFWIKGR